MIVAMMMSASGSCAISVAMTLANNPALRWRQLPWTGPEVRRLRAYFLTGLLTLIPIWLVWIVFKFVLGLLSDIGRPLVAPLSSSLALAYPGMLGWLDDPWAQGGHRRVRHRVFHHRGRWACTARGRPERCLAGSSC